jgi:hypothetical protein
VIDALQRQIEALGRQVEGVQSGMRSGFDSLSERMDATNAHLKELNGRTRRNESDIARHDERIKFLAVDDAEKPDSENRRITMRDVQMVSAGVIGAIAVLSFLFKVLPAVLKAIQP